MYGDCHYPEMAELQLQPEIRSLKKDPLTLFSELPMELITMIYLEVLEQTSLVGHVNLMGLNYLLDYFLCESLQLFEYVITTNTYSVDELRLKLPKGPLIHTKGKQIDCLSLRSQRFRKLVNFIQVQHLILNSVNVVGMDPKSWKTQLGDLEKLLVDSVMRSSCDLKVMRIDRCLDEDSMTMFSMRVRESSIPFQEFGNTINSLACDIENIDSIFPYFLGRNLRRVDLLVNLPILPINYLDSHFACIFDYQFDPIVRNISVIFGKPSIASLSDELCKALNSNAYGFPSYTVHSENEITLESPQVISLVAHKLNMVADCLTKLVLTIGYQGSNEADVTFLNDLNRIKELVLRSASGDSPDPTNKLIFKQKIKLPNVKKLQLESLVVPNDLGGFEKLEYLNCLSCKFEDNETLCNIPQSLTRLEFICCCFVQDDPVFFIPGKLKFIDLMPRTSSEIHSICPRLVYNNLNEITLDYISLDPNKTEYNLQKFVDTLPPTVTQFFTGPIHHESFKWDFRKLTRLTSLLGFQILNNIDMDKLPLSLKHIADWIPLIDPIDDHFRMLGLKSLKVDLSNYTRDVSKCIDEICITFKELHSLSAWVTCQDIYITQLSEAEQLFSFNLVFDKESLDYNYQAKTFRYSSKSLNGDYEEEVEKEGESNKEQEEVFLMKESSAQMEKQKVTIFLTEVADSLERFEVSGVLNTKNAFTLIDVVDSAIEVSVKVPKITRNIKRCGLIDEVFEVIVE